MVSVFDKDDSMNNGRRYSVRYAAALALAALLSTQAWGQSWPAKPIKLIQGFAAGGNGDIIARLVAQKLTDPLHQPIVVEARTGSGGNLASDFVAKSPADGYTIILLTGGHAVSAALYKQLPVDPVDEFTMVSLVSQCGCVVATASDSPLKSIADVIADAKKSPGTLSFTSPGTGTTQHLAGELFKSAAGLDMIHVPYRGGTAPVTDVIAGRVSMMFEAFTPTLPQIRAGKLRALGVTSTGRSALLPEIPPVAETVPNFEVTSWMGIAAPAKLPGPILERLNAEMIRIVGSADMRERLASVGGAEARSSTPAEMRAHIAGEIQKWKRVVEDAKIERQ
jgi:tripartite-type tricarboxylate transporter receptor subunit TctC